MFDLIHASMIKEQYRSKWHNPLYWNIQKWLKPNFYRLYSRMTGSKIISVKCVTPNFVVIVNVLFPICCHIGWDMQYLSIFAEEVVTLLGAITDKWVWTLVCGRN